MTRVSVMCEQPTEPASRPRPAANESDGRNMAAIPGEGRDNGRGGLPGRHLVENRTTGQSRDRPGKGTHAKRTLGDHDRSRGEGSCLTSRNERQARLLPVNGWNVEITNPGLPPLVSPRHNTRFLAGNRVTGPCAAQSSTTAGSGVNVSNQLRSPADGRVPRQRARRGGEASGSADGNQLAELVSSPTSSRVREESINSHMRPAAI